MADSRAGLSAKTFLLPQAQPQMAAPVEQPFNDGVQALEGLQYVQGQTADYYKKVSALKSFMQSVNKNLGIDVRVPDMSRPESIELNQIYQTAIADILAQGNELKQGAALNTMHVNRGDKFTDTYSQNSAARARYGSDYYNGLDKIVTEANDAVSTPSYDDAELKAKQQKYDETKAYYEKIKADDPSMTKYADDQIAGLVRPSPRVYRPNNTSTAADRRYGRQVQAGANLVKKTTNLLWGAAESFEPDSTKPNEYGNPLLVSTEFAGKKYGDGTIKEWRIDPDKNTIKLVVTTSQGNKVIDVTGQRQDPQSLAATISGLPQEVITDAMYEVGGYDDAQQIVPENLLAKNHKEIFETNIQKSKTSGTSQKLANLKTKLSEMKDNSWSFKPWETLDVGQFKIKRAGDNKFEIVNMAEALKLTDKDAAKFYKANKTYAATEAGIKQLLDFLSKYGAVDKFFTSTPQDQEEAGTQVAPTTQQPQETEAQRILREYREKNK